MQMDDVQSAILLGTGYEIAEITLRTLWKTKRAETEFTVIYDHLHFIPLNGFGVRLLKILTTPDWNETLLDLLFDPNDDPMVKAFSSMTPVRTAFICFHFWTATSPD